MGLKNFEAINHPARMRIFQLLSHQSLSTHQLAQQLGLPLPSIYRHVKKLYEAGLLVVTATCQVNGIEERFYASVEGLIDPAELEKPGGLENFAKHVTVYGTVAAQATAQYVLQRGAPDLANLAVRDHIFFATEEEFIRLREAIYALLQTAEQQAPAPGRIKRRWFVMAHPLTTTLDDSNPMTQINTNKTKDDCGG